MRDKILAFEYLVKLLLDWNGVEDPQSGRVTPFSHLKVLKLLFLVSAVEADKTNNGLLDLFDDFVAMPYGPVESEIYNAILNNKTTYYTFTQNGLEQKTPDINFDNLDADIKSRILSSVNRLRKYNSKLVTCKPFELVDITHKWSCWSIAYKYALSLGVRSIKIPNESIKLSLKFFS